MRCLPQGLAVLVLTTLVSTPASAEGIGLLDGRTPIWKGDASGPRRQVSVPAAQAVPGGDGRSSSAPGRPQPRVLHTRGAHRSLLLAFSAALASGQSPFTTTGDAFASTYQEAGSATVTYGAASPLQFQAQGAFLAGRIGIGGGLVAHTRSEPAAIAASVPHPFFFDRPRTASGTSAESLKVTSLEVQLPLVWQQSIRQRVSVLFFGGPSVFRVSRDLVARFAVQESYPYDEASIGVATTARQSAVAFGFHAGAQAYWGGRTAVGGGAMFSRGTVDYRADGATAREQVGGFRLLVGVRQRF